MGEVVRFNNPYWKCFYLPDRKQRWLYTDEESAIRLKDKDFFNKDTIGIIIYKRYETEENKTEPIECYFQVGGLNYG